MKTEKKYYWLSIEGQTIGQWKKPMTHEGKRAVFKLMRKKARLLGNVKFEIDASRHEKPIWESGRWDVICEMELVQ